MALRSVAAAIFVCILGALGGPAYVFSQPAQQSAPPAPPKFDSRADFRQRLQAIANLPADPCAAPNGSLESWRSGEDEWQLFQDATKIVTEGLDATPTRPQSSPADQATVLLKELQETSAGIDGHWPEDSRLHFQVLDLAPGLVVKMTLPVASAAAGVRPDAQCASAGIARRLVRELPPYVFADELRVTRIGWGRERVELGDDPTYHFEVAERSGRWVVVAFA